jgi:ABC-type branched-subunit amino acid transport system permease subunit
MDTPAMPTAHHPLLRVLAGLRMTVRAETGAHAELRSRIAGLTAVSLVLDLAAAGAALAFEHGRGGITSFGNALFWTTTQMLTISSQLPNPLTTGGKFLDVAMEIYAMVVVSSLAGVFASFFHRRTRERHASHVPERLP